MDGSLPELGICVRVNLWVSSTGFIPPAAPANKAVVGELLKLRFFVVGWGHNVCN